MLLARTRLLTLVCAFAALPLPVAAAGSCSSDVFAIDASSVTVELCPPATRRPGKSVVIETISLKGQAPLVREITLDDVPGAETARSIDDVPLTKLGLSRTLHLTIAERAGNVRLEHALLVPGAVALK